MRLVRFCANASYDACNWAADITARSRISARREHLLRCQRVEGAKRRLIYGLLRLDLPLVSKFENPESGLAFDFLADSGATFPERAQVTTGHARGLITINLAEADDAERASAPAWTWRSRTAGDDAGQAQQITCSDVGSVLNANRARRISVGRRAARL